MEHNSTKDTLIYDLAWSLTKVPRSHFKKMDDHMHSDLERRCAATKLVDEMELRGWVFVKKGGKAKAHGTPELRR